MTIAAWLDAALKDAEHRRLPEVRPLIENLARAAAALRAASWNADASEGEGPDGRT